MTISHASSASETMRGLRVGIVGGSIAGCVTAIELASLGADVTVFERSRHLQDRGAGIGLALSLIETLKERSLVDADMGHIPVFKRRFVIRCDEESRQLGRTIWEQSFASGSTNWDVLFGQLRRRVPDARFRQGRHVVSIIHQADDEVLLEFADGSPLPFDLVICADGYDSLGRRTLFPAHEPQYVGYIIWRGLIPECMVADIASFEGVRVFAVYEGGHAIFYLVPGRNGELELGSRRLNWGIYDKVTDEDLRSILTDAEGTVHHGSLPPGAASEAQVAYVHDLACTHFPSFVAQVVRATDRPFVQSIYEAHVPAYHRGRICLIGDASTLARPHTSAGSVKAMTDALALSKALATQPSVEAALQMWDDEQCAAGNQLVSLGQALGEALVRRVPDWSAMNPATMESWYAGVIAGKNWYRSMRFRTSAEETLVVIAIALTFLVLVGVFSRSRFMATIRSACLAIAISLATLPITGWAEQSSRALVLGILFVSAGRDDPSIHAIGKGLLELGYVEGRDFRFEYLGAQGHVERLQPLAEELVQLKVDFIIVATEGAMLAAKRSTSTIPIVAALFDYDPVAAGLIDSLAHPGGNITGVFTRAPELIGKRLELLKEAIPSLSRVAVFYDSYGRRQVGDAQSASRALGVQLVLTELTPPYSYGIAFKSAKQKKAGAAMFLYSPAFYVVRESIAQQAVDNRLPVIGYSSDFARAGFFLSYGTDALKTFKRLAYFIDRVVKGARPNDLPVEQPSELELVVNLKTAKALNLMVPQSILLRANEAIR